MEMKHARFVHEKRHSPQTPIRTPPRDIHAHAAVKMVTGTTTLDRSSRSVSASYISHLSVPGQLSHYLLNLGGLVPRGRLAVRGLPLGRV